MNLVGEPLKRSQTLILIPITDNQNICIHIFKKVPRKINLHVELKEKQIHKLK